MLIIMTRWHVDDLLGRFIERWSSDIKVLRLPGDSREAGEAIASTGEALFPELKPLDFLLARKQVHDARPSWESEYQQHPIVVGGGIFPIEKLTVAAAARSRSDHQRSVRYYGQGRHRGRWRLSRQAC